MTPWTDSLSMWKGKPRKNSSPEEINDSPVTAPSKRVALLVPGYQKPLLGLLAVLEIGLDAIRRECPHFRAWLDTLEGWPHVRN